MMRWLCLFLMCCCGSLRGGHQLSVCAIFRDEAPYLKEWIEFHKMQGVEHFYLYNNLSSDEYLEVLEDYGAEVTLVDWPFAYKPQTSIYEKNEWLEIQTNAYSHALSHFGDESEWIAFIDVDEFLFCPSGMKLPTFLKDYEGGLAVNWLVFGTSGLETLPPNTLQIEALTRCAKKNQFRNHCFKSIVQPCYVESGLNAHLFLIKEGHGYRTVLGEEISDSIHSKMVSHDLIRINHYWTRTKSYFREKKLKSRRHRRQTVTRDKLIKLAKYYNRREDHAILQFVPKLRKRMGYED